MAPPRGQQRAMRLRQILASQAARRHPSQPGTPVARGADELAQVDSRRRVADARRRIASSRAGAEPGAPFSIIACFSEAEIGSAAALLPHFARLVGRAPRTAVALVGAEPQEAGASPGGDLPPWDAVVRVAVPRARERLEPAMTREALLEAVVRADGADLLLLVAGSGAVVDAGQIPWIDLASSRLRTDPDLVAIAIPHGGVRGARGAARGAPPGVKGATWDSRLRLWRGRGVTGLAFVTDRRRLRDALETRAGAPDRAEPLASVLEDVLGGTVAKSFGTLATKEAWTLRLPTSLRIAEPGASPNRQSV
jgi:hypothetical protein